MASLNWCAWEPTLKGPAYLGWRLLLGEDRRIGQEGGVHGEWGGGIVRQAGPALNY